MAMARRYLILPTFAFLLALVRASPCLGQEGPANPRLAAGIAAGGFEVEAGLTTRAQALTIFDAHTDARLAMMTSEFVPSPYLRMLTPFKPLWLETRGGGGVDRAGYYWKFALNEFTLDFQEDPDTGGIGTSSARHDYGTRVEGFFLAAAPIFVVERSKPDGTVPWTLGVGFGAGYLTLDGDAMIKEAEGSGTLVRKDVEFSGPAISLFVLGRYAWNMLVLGFEMGIVATMTEPYSHDQSYVAVDVGLRTAY